MGIKTLYAELKELRDNLKNNTKINRANSDICSDDFLSKLAKEMPTNLNELLAVSGATDDFCNNFGKYFIKTINEYKKQNAQTKFKNNSNLVYTLKELEKKLVNINKRNKLLYTNKLANKNAIDILSLMDEKTALDFIFSKNSDGIKICNYVDMDSNRNIEACYNKLITLLREVNRDFREKGQYDLYIAYPFLRGRLIGEDFEINAPLVLFPVVLTKEVGYFNLKIDGTRDVIYNNNILIANYKFNRVNKPLPNNIIYDLNASNFFANVGAFYKKEKMDFSMQNEINISKYVAPSESTKIYKKGELEVVNTMILGKFNTYSSSMQKDLNTIIESGSVNGLLEDLLSGMDDYDFYQDNEENNYDVFRSVNESELLYINPINSTQENVILASDNCKELVVQGPPGTGKSQVITSLIANAVSKNKTVLMVSEKKSALDVVYSRLGDLSKYVLLLDDVNKKDKFYNQIDSMCKVDNFNKTLLDTKEIDVDIDESIKSLDLISKKLKDKSTYGKEIYKLYQEVPKWDLNKEENAKKYEIITKNVLDSVKKYDYNLLRKVYTTLCNKELVNSLETYMSVTNDYPEIVNFKDNVSDEEIMNMQQDCRKIISAKKILKELKLSNKYCVKKALNKKAKMWFKLAFSHSNKADRQDFIDNTAKYMSMTDRYSQYVKSRIEYENLQDEVKDYYNSVHNVAKKMNESFFDVNKMIYVYIINTYLINFENENRAILNKINDYGSVLNKLSGLLENKIKLTKENLSYILTQNIVNITNSKRYGEIRRMIESNKRWSVAKFTDKFFIEMFESIKVWLLTPEVVSEILPLKAELFDLVIFDEASQMYIEKGIPAIMRAKSVIIAGDSKQLRPSNLGSGRLQNNVDDETAMDDMIAEDCGIAALEEESLLDVARFKYPPVMLDFHYRSKYAELIAFSNYAFYGGKLNVSPNPYPPEKPPIEVVKVKGGLWENRANKAEAIKVVEKLKQILKKRENNETIGIITFNSAQRDLIMDVIDQVSLKDKAFAKAVAKEFDRKENGEDIGLFVKNIENVQGDERDIIIFSIGYAENEQGKIIKNFGWLNQRGGENRLNVAISRAKTKVLIITSISPEDLDVANCKNNGPKILKKYLQYAIAVSEQDKETANRILLSFVDNDNSQIFINNKPKIAEKIKKNLETYGYRVEENIGVGAYTIDMGVNYNGKYLMGIEFDTSLYNVNINNRERDFHRWKYFKLRGWNIYRVWESAWWDDYNAEFSKMLDYLEKLKEKQAN